MPLYPYDPNKIGGQGLVVRGDGLVVNTAIPEAPVRPKAPNMTEAQKFDDGKLAWDLVPPGPLDQIVEIYTLGAKKYAPRNWEKGLHWSRVFAAIMRHLWAWRRGEIMDAESGKHHLAHAAWGCFALLEYTTTHPELNDLHQEPAAMKH